MYVCIVITYREDTWDHGRRRGWTVAPGAGPAKGRAKRAEQGHHRRADDHLSTENYVKFVVLFNIADGFLIGVKTMSSGTNNNINRSTVSTV